MATPLKINVGAIDTPYQVTLYDGDGSIPDLTGATVVFHLRQFGSPTYKVNAAGAIFGSPTLGQVSYNWLSADVDTVGLYEASWVVTYPGGTVRTYPSDDTDLIEIVTGPNQGYILQGACSSWTTVQQVRIANPSLPASGAANYPSDLTVQSAINVATDLLFEMSGSQFPGECATVVRPCSPGNCYARLPYLRDHSADPPMPCGCNDIPSIDLGLWPVVNIVYVKIDGAIVDPSTYRLDSNRYLTRMAVGTDFHNDGWPSCQYLDRPSSAAGTFEVMAEYGLKPPAAGAWAANRLAGELLKGSLGLQCTLPKNVGSVNRQQLSFTAINVSQLDNGLTGLNDVDLFLMAYNPGKHRGQTMVWSPDLPQGSYRAGL